MEREIRIIIIDLDWLEFTSVAKTENNFFLRNVKNQGHINRELLTRENGKSPFDKQIRVYCHATCESKTLTRNKSKAWIKSMSPIWSNHLAMAYFKDQFIFPILVHIVLLKDYGLNYFQVKTLFFLIRAYPKWSIAWDV